MSLGQNLQFYRKRKNITQEQLAEQLCVSRQTISKWEADASYPEMEKILQLCEMFGCSMDTLLRGEAKEDLAEDTAGYDSHMNRFSKRIVIGIELIILGVAGGILADSFYAPAYISDLVTFSFVIAGALVLVATGLQHRRFAEKNPKIQPFYKEEEIERFEEKFPVFITGGIGVILAGVVVSALSEQFPEAKGYTKEIYNAVLLLFIAVGTGLLVYAGMQKSKFNIKEYNEENKPKSSQKERLQGMGCGCIMIFATILFLIGGFIFGKWEICWICYPIGALFCGIASIIINGIYKEEP